MAFINKAKNRKRYTVQDVVTNQFYQMPKFLFEGEFKTLINDARVLYSLLRDRHELSISNGWVNENNEVYLIYTRKNMQEMLGVSDKTVKKAIDQLKVFGLMEEERIGLNKPNRIYITIEIPDNSGVEKTPIPESKLQNRKNSDLRSEEIPIQGSEKLRTNKTEINNTEINNQSIRQPNNENNSIDGKIDKDNIASPQKTPVPEEYSYTLDPKNLGLDYDSAKKFFEKKLCFDKFKVDKHRRPTLDVQLVGELELNILEMYFAESVKIHGKNIPNSIIRKAIDRLTPFHIEGLLDRYREVSLTTSIKNTKAYIQTMIYNIAYDLDLSTINQIENHRDSLMKNTIDNRQSSSLYANDTL